MNSAPVMQPLMEVIEDSTNEKWRVAPSEYDNLKDYYARAHDGSLQGYDDWFNNQFIILTSEEIQHREELISKRKEIKKRIRQLRSKKAEIETELESLIDESALLLKQINWED